MSIVTKTVFKRMHVNGTVLIEVPPGTQVRVKPFYGGQYWTVEVSQPVGKNGETAFRVNVKEYNQLLGA